MGVKVPGLVFCRGADLEGRSAISSWACIIRPEILQAAKSKKDITYTVG